MLLKYYIPFNSSLLNKSNTNESYIQEQIIRESLTDKCSDWHKVWTYIRNTNWFKFFS